MYLLLLLYAGNNAHFKNHDEKQLVREGLVTSFSKATNCSKAEFTIRYKKDKRMSDSKGIFLHIPPKLKDKLPAEQHESIKTFLTSNLPDCNVSIEFRETR